MYNTEQKYVRLDTKMLTVVILWGIECGSFYFLLFHFFVLFSFYLINMYTHLYSKNLFNKNNILKQSLLYYIPSQCTSIDPLSRDF